VVFSWRERQKFSSTAGRHHGLRFFDRIGSRDDLELIMLPEETRKGSRCPQGGINSSDITFLACRTTPPGGP
jgi:hypothetical protein